MTGLPFTKMHGLGNDFVVFDARRAPLALDGARVRAIADRRTGVGCDQVIVVEPPRNGGTDAYLRFWNQDGGEVAACGNGTRCAARLLLDETEQTSMILETDAGRLTAQEAGGGQVRVDMGPARLDWRDIPLARAADTLHVAVGAGPLGDAVAVNMGNPHAVFFVDDVDAVPLEALGPAWRPIRSSPSTRILALPSGSPMTACVSGCGSAARASPKRAARAPAPRRSPARGEGSPDAVSRSSSTAASWGSFGARTAMSR